MLEIFSKHPSVPPAVYKLIASSYRLLARVTAAWPGLKVFSYTVTSSSVALELLGVACKTKEKEKNKDLPKGPRNPQTGMARVRMVTEPVGFR